MYAAEEEPDTHQGEDVPEIKESFCVGDTGNLSHLFNMYAPEEGPDIHQAEMGAGPRGLVDEGVVDAPQITLQGAVSDTNPREFEKYRHLWPGIMIRPLYCPPENNRGVDEAARLWTAFMVAVMTLVGYMNISGDVPEGRDPPGTQDAMPHGLLPHNQD